MAHKLTADKRVTTHINSAIIFCEQYITILYITHKQIADMRFKAQINSAIIRL